MAFDTENAMSMWLGKKLHSIFLLNLLIVLDITVSKYSKNDIFTFKTIFILSGQNVTEMHETGHFAALKICTKTRKMVDTQIFLRKKCFSNSELHYFGTLITKFDSILFWKMLVLSRLKFEV